MSKISFAKSYIKNSVKVLAVVLIALLCLRVYGDWNIAQEINRPQTQTSLKSNFDRHYNYTELFVWESQHLNFTYETIQRNTNPVDILNYGKGRCGEFAILYVALCEANGYDARFVDSILGDHEWAQVNINGTWIHVDPLIPICTNGIGKPHLF